MTTILQIEDNLANRVLTERVLNPHGYHLIQADTGERGIEMAIENQPDLILIDIGLPDYDGHTVLSLLRQIPDLSLTPFVAITAWPADKAREMCERYGYDGCITKPIDVKTFPALIQKFLQLKKTSTTDQDFRE
ncbi:MAG: response regulator [Chloroflexi bacterium]|nr:response regulator [Chloroflexota bacterium]